MNQSERKKYRKYEDLTEQNLLKKFLNLKKYAEVFKKFRI